MVWRWSSIEPATRHHHPKINRRAPPVSPFLLSTQRINAAALSRTDDFAPTAAHPHQPLKNISVDHSSTYHGPRQLSASFNCILLRRVARNGCCASSPAASLAPPRLELIPSSRKLPASSLAPSIVTPDLPDTTSTPGSQPLALDQSKLTALPDFDMPKAATKKGGKAEKRGKGKKGTSFPLQPLCAASLFFSSTGC